MDNIIVLNLNRATERMQRMIDQFTKLGIEDYIFYSSVDGKDIKNESIIGNIQAPHFGAPRQFKKGEIGCLMSHIGALKLAKALDYDWVLIFEDDVVLCNDFKSRLQLVFKYLPDNWEHVFLSGHIYNQPPPFALPSLLPVTFKVSGAYSFIVRNTAYDKVISKLQSFNTTSDDLYEHMILSKELKSYIFFPFLSYPLVEDSYIWETSGNKTPHASVKYYKDKL